MYNLTSYFPKVFSKKSKILQTGVFILVLLFTFILRAHNYDRVPTANHLDEMLYAWSGIYLIETGTPISWSTLDYPKRAEVYKGKISYKGGLPEASVTLYKPWLDQPPLFSLIVGSFAHLFKADRTQFIPSSYIRFPTVIFGAITSVLIFLIANEVSGFWTAILAMIIFGTTPIMVFGSRTALPENLISLLFTITLYLLLKFEKSLKFNLLLFIPLLVGVAGLSKPTGFFIAPFAAFIAFRTLYRQNKLSLAIKSCLYILIFSLSFFAIFIAYGLHYDPEIFWKIINIQSFRPVGFSSLAWFFISPSFDTSLFKDSWYVFCLLSAAYFIFSPKRGNKQLISLAFVYWVIVVMISGGEGDLLSWYRYPTFPTLAILGAWGTQTIVEKANIFTSFLAFGLLLGGRHLLVNAFRVNVSPTYYRTVFALAMLPSVLSNIFQKKIFERASRLVIITIIIIGIYLNIKYIYNAFEITCESISCPIVPSTFLSTLHFPVIWKLLILGEPTYR